MDKVDSRSNKRIPTMAITLISIFAVLYFTFRMIPAFPMLGVSGGAFALADVLAPVYGIILGPTIGAISIILGTFLAIVMGKPMIFMGFDFLPAMMNAFIVGLIIKKQRILPIVLYTLLFILFLIHPYTAITALIQIPQSSFKTQFFFAWLHLIALLILISPFRNKAVKWLEENENIAKQSLAILFLSFIGTMAQHLTGSLLYETIWGAFMNKPLEAFKLLWHIIFWLYPIERTFITISATIIGVPLLRIIRKLLKGFKQGLLF